MHVLLQDYSWNQYELESSGKTRNQIWKKSYLMNLNLIPVFLEKFKMLRKIARSCNKKHFNKTLQTNTPFRVHILHSANCAHLLYIGSFSLSKNAKIEPFKFWKIITSRLSFFLKQEQIAFLHKSSRVLLLFNFIMNKTCSSGRGRIIKLPELDYNHTAMKTFFWVAVIKLTNITLNWA